MRHQTRFGLGLGIIGVLVAGCVVVPGGHGRHRGAVLVGPAPVVIAARPRMVFVTEFGVAFAPDLDIEVYEVGGVWFSFRSGGWYRANAYDGPWGVVEHRHLPKGLAKIKPGQVRKFYFEREGKGNGKHKDKGHEKGKNRDDD